MCFLELLVNVEQDFAQIERTHANRYAGPLMFTEEKS